MQLLKQRAAAAGHAAYYYGISKQLKLSSSSWAPPQIQLKLPSAGRSAKLRNWGGDCPIVTVL